MWARVQESCVRLFGWAAVERCAVLCCGVGAGWAEVGLGLGLRLSGEAWYPSPKVLPSLLRRILFCSHNPLSRREAWEWFSSKLLLQGIIDVQAIDHALE